MITSDHIGIEGMLKPVSVFPEDSFNLKAVTLDNKLTNLESLHGRSHMDTQGHHRE